MIKERTWAVIELDKLRRNFRNIKKQLKDVKILGAVKAEAYGHGGFEVSKVLKEEGIDALGVASLEEAVNLKKLNLPIVILSPTFTYDIPTIIDEGFIATVTDRGFADLLDKESVKCKKKTKIHIEIDTGMSRTGIPYYETIEFIEEIKKKQFIEIEGIFTHFAEAESEDKSFTYLQLERFKDVLNSLKEKGISIPYSHTANSPAILDIKESYFNMVRPGLLLYGLYPKEKKNIEVLPIMSLKSRVCSLRWIDKGEVVSYGRTYTAKKKIRVATISIGYGDGFPRLLSNRGEIIIKGRRCPIIGNVCMDLTMVDVTNVDDVKIEDEVTVIGKEGGEEISADEVALLAQTINYEIATNIGPRVPRIYKENGVVILRKSLISGNCIYHDRHQVIM